MSILCMLIVLPLLIFVVVEVSYNKIFAHHPKKEWYKAFTLIPLLLILGIGAAILSLLNTGETKSRVIWENSVPGNLEIESVEDVPSYTLEAYLEKSDQPVYLKVDSWGSHYVNVQLALFDPNGNLMINLPPETRIPCHTRTGCSPLIYQLQLVESGTYRIEIKSLSAFAHEITVSFFQSEWLDSR
jgi:hypothetical protein